MAETSGQIDNDQYFLVVYLPVKGPKLIPAPPCITLSCPHEISASPSVAEIEIYRIPPNFKGSQPLWSGRCT